MKKLFALFLILGSLSIIRTNAQIPVYQNLTFVSSAPSGSCSLGSPVQVVISTGIQYTCQGGTWAAAAGSISGTVGSGTANSLTCYPSTGTVVGTCTGISTDGSGALAAISSNAPDKGAQVFNVKAYGAKGDGTTDDTAAIASANTAAGSAGGCLYFPAGTFLTDTVTFTNSNLCVLGSGMDRAKIKSLSGNTIFLASISVSSGLFQNFTLLPNGGTGAGISIPSTLGFAKDITVKNVIAEGFPGEAISMPGAFNTKISDSQASSTGNNAFDVHGGPACLFENTYAHGAGNGYGGYRVHSGSCTFISANGIDGTSAGQSWGIFGDTVAQDGDLAYAFPVIIGSNIEAFTQYGVWLKSGSGAEFIDDGFGNDSANSTAPVMAIRADSGDALTTIDAQTSFSQSGSYSQGWANGYPIHGIAACRMLLTGYNPGGIVSQSDTCYNDNNTLAYNIPTVEQTQFSFGIFASGFPYLVAINGFITQASAQTVSTSPTITGCGTISSQTGGGLAGTFVTSATSCTPVLAALPSTTNGYACMIWDQTHPTTPEGNISSTATSATFGTFSTTASDVIAFNCGISY